jgi:hypothetical protein
VTQFYEERPPQQQQFQDSYGQDTRQGTVEEQIHRRITKRMDHSRSPGLPDILPSHGRASLIIALCSLALAAAAIAFTFVSHSSADTQISQLRDQVATMNTELGRTADTRTVNGLAQKVNAMAPVVGGMALFNQNCSQYLTGAGGGPQTFYMPCTDQKP